MYPSVYLFSKKEEWFCLYLDQFSTLEALCLLPSTLEIKITCFGASCYKNYGWATEKDIPALYTIQDLRDFFQNNESIGLIEFETKLENLGYLNTHDDGECHLI